MGMCSCWYELTNRSFRAFSSILLLVQLQLALTGRRLKRGPVDKVRVRAFIDTEGEQEKTTREL